MNLSSLALNFVWLISLGKQIPQSFASLPLPNLGLSQNRGLFYREGHVCVQVCVHTQTHTSTYIHIYYTKREKERKRSVCLYIIPKENRINLKKVIFPLSTEKGTVPRVALVFPRNSFLQSLMSKLDFPTAASPASTIL